MKETLLASYERKSTLPHYCRSAWAKDKHIVKVECVFCSREAERNGFGEDVWLEDKEGNIIPPEEVLYDFYSVITTNVRGFKKGKYFKTKEEANRYFKILKDTFPDLKRIWVLDKSCTIG